MLRVTVIIKTLNEEKKLCRAIESSIAALGPYGGEIVIADSVSTDRTIEVAKQYPVTIVQLRNPDERRCGVGPQLGYQHSCAEYLYVLDGDMELKAPFLRRAVDILDRDASVAGVGGYVQEMRVDNLELKGRVERVKRLRQSERVDGLYGGALYRRVAISDVGYISDRNLHAFEEYDLGARLRLKGWRLVRLEDQAVDHYSYAMSSWRLLWHRVRTGRCLSPGELVRAAIDRHYVVRAVREVRLLQLILGVWFYWALMLTGSQWSSGSTWTAVYFLTALGVPLLVKTVRRKSLMQGTYSVITWHLYAVGLMIGLAWPRRSPSERIESAVLQSAMLSGELNDRKNS
jgi:GT2 family glycosyltransferase